MTPLATRSRERERYAIVSAHAEHIKALSTEGHSGSFLPVEFHHGDSSPETQPATKGGQRKVKEGLKMRQVLRDIPRIALNLTKRPFVEAKLKNRVNRQIQSLVAGLSYDASAQHHLLVGPSNTAGQAREWTRAANLVDGVSARSVKFETIGGETFRFHTDLSIPREIDKGKIALWHDHVIQTTNSAIFESCRPLLGRFTTGGDCLSDAGDFLAAGAAVAVLMHGSDVRDPGLHKRQVTHSPFHDAEGTYWDSVFAKAHRNREILAQFPGQILVSTPGLLSHVPGSIWLPLVVDAEKFESVPHVPVLEREVPVVLHAPSNPRFKGTAVIEPVLHRLESQGLIEYRQLTGVPHNRMPAFLSDVDIVIDQINLGDTGVLLAEAMFSGRLVVANIAPSTRERIGLDVPVAQADPETLEAVIRQILADREQYREIAALGPEYASELHDGRAAMTVLGKVFGWNSLNARSSD